MNNTKGSAMSDMRKHFESWSLGQGWSVDRTDEGDYRTMTTDAAWGAWIACTQDTEERIKVLEDALENIIDISAYNTIHKIALAALGDKTCSG